MAKKGKFGGLHGVSKSFGKGKSETSAKKVSKKEQVYEDDDDNDDDDKLLDIYDGSKNHDNDDDEDDEVYGYGEEDDEVIHKCQQVIDHLYIRLILKFTIG